MRPLLSVLAFTGLLALPALSCAGDTARPFGWWRSDTVCLELFANGDFELSVRGMGPKVLVLGSATVAAADEAGQPIELTTQRIWHARFTGPCREVHELGTWVESEDVLGRTFAPGSTTSMRVRSKGDDQLELCGVECATLTRATPSIGGRWRRPAGDDGASLGAGDLLELRIDGASGHLEVGVDQERRSTVQGTVVVTSRGEDAFDLNFRPSAPPDPPVALLGEPLAAGSARSFRLRRLPDQRLELCGDGGRCVALERDFDPYDHDLR